MPKNNTIAVAVAALLVGGVATAGYMNSRSHSNTTPVPQAVPVAAQLPAPTTATASAPATMAAPLATGLIYADVLDVKPINAREPLYASVIGSEPIRESNTVNTPQQECRDVVVQERLPERDGNVGGTVAGALIGATGQLLTDDGAAIALMIGWFAVRGLLRLAVGIEDSRDIIDLLAAGLAAALPTHTN